MATSAEIVEQVGMLAECYGRTFRDRGIDGYVVALSDIEAKHLRTGVAGLLREKLQFMPTPAEVRAHSRAARELEWKAAGEAESRRLVCARCEDRGILRCFNRRWFAEHRDEFGPALFSEGWLNVARAWCRESHGEDFLVWVICGCNCQKSQVYLRNKQLWHETQRDPSVKKTKPAFLSVYDADWDCLEQLSADPHSTREQDYAAALTAFQGQDTRTWTGNWTP